MTGLIPRRDVARFCDEVRKKSPQLIFTNGCFDILHAGHVNYLAQARALGDFLFVGLNSDSSVSRYKGPKRPVQSQEDRATILLSLKAVDAVSVFDEDEPLELIKLVKPSMVVKGGDWPSEKICGKDFVEKYGGKVVSLPYLPGHSTSDVIKKVLEKA